MTFKSFSKGLDARGIFRIRPRLAPIRKVLQLLGNPQNNIPVIHIAGTNGKGSVAAALESVLRANGYKTGLYTSPHLVDLRERIQLNGQPIKRGFLSAAKRVLQAEHRAQVTLTYFELLTAMAFVAFAEEKRDISIIECGLGGTWDATNTVKSPLLCIMNSIGLDHTEWLGRTVQKIAAQKAGIIKPGAVVISAVQGHARTVVRSAARKAGTRFIELDRDFKGDTLATSWPTGVQTVLYTQRDESPEIIPFGLVGPHQADNAAICMAAVGVLVEKGWHIERANRDSGLRYMKWPGRLEHVQVNDAAPILLDGAHNPPAAETLVRTLSQPPFQNLRKTFIFSAYKDKDIKAIAGHLSPYADEVCLCRLPGPRGASLQSLRQVFSHVQGPVREFHNLRAALDAAWRDTPRDGLIVITGSLALIGEFKKLKWPNKISHETYARH